MINLASKKESKDYNKKGTKIIEDKINQLIPTKLNIDGMQLKMYYNMYAF